MSQSQMFYEDVFDVGRAAVQAAGGAKVVAGKIWPNMPIGEAQRKLLDCLNRDRPEKLCIEEFLVMMKLAKESGFHQAKHWIDTELGYQPTPPADPKIERDRLADELARMTEAYKNMQRTAERLLEPTLKVAK